MHTSGRTYKRFAASLAVGMGAVLLFGACSPDVAADHAVGSGPTSTLPSGDNYYDDTDSGTDANYSDETVSAEPESGSDASVGSDASESDGRDTAGYVGSSKWVLDQSEREMWNSYENRINNW